MALVGDFGRLAALRAAIGQIASGGFMRTLTTRMAAELQTQVLRELTEKRDPYGTAWAPRKKQPAWAAMAFGAADWPLLQKTEKLIKSVRGRPTARGVKITLVDYAGYHQTGTYKMVARKLVPDAERGIGPVWQRGLELVTGNLLGEIFQLQAAA